MRRAEAFLLHPLGFFYLQDDLGNGETRRVHVWLPDEEGRADNDCHQHSFEIDSLIVAGRMHSTLYNFRPTDNGPEREFVVAYDSGRSLLRPTGRRGVLDLTASFEVAAGQRYHLSAGVVHRVTVIGRPCISILTTTERGAPIYSYGGNDEPSFFRRSPNEREAATIREVIRMACGDH